MNTKANQQAAKAWQIARAMLDSCIDLEQACGIDEQTRDHLYSCSELQFVVMTTTDQIRALLARVLEEVK